MSALCAILHVARINSSCIILPLVSIDSVESGTKVIGTPKTEAGKRYVFIPADFREDLKRHIEGKSPMEFVFPQMDGVSMMTDTIMQNNWRSFSRQMDLAMGAETTSHGHIYDPKDIDENGRPIYPDPKNPSLPRNGHKIAPDLVPYCLRHTYCTDLQRRGVDIETVKYLMGHEDISTTSNIYTHTDKCDALRAAEKYNNTL